MWMSALLWYYTIMILGSEAGSHRLFSHKSYRVSNPMRLLLGWFSAICVYGSPLDWLVSHLTHHVHSDTPEDPTSPQHVGVANVLFGLWRNQPLVNTMMGKRLAIGFMKSEYNRFLHYSYIFTILCWMVFLFLLGPMWLIFGFSIPALGCFYTLNLISVLGHAKNKPTTNLWLNIIAPGAGYHRAHHDEPAKPRFSTYDFTGYLIERFIASDPVSKTAKTTLEPLN